MRWINLGLSVGAIVFVVFVVVPDWRRIRYKFMGNVVVDGSTFYLQPTDNYLTPSVINEGEYEPTETLLVRRILKEGDILIDVGANIGWYTVHGAKLVGESGKVIAFEPEPSNLEILRKNVRVNNLKNVVVEDTALSDAAGTFKLFLEKDNLGMHSLVMEHDGNRYIDVKTIRFDDYWKDKGPIKLVKIDTEGAEGLILHGMWETLKTQPGVELIVEFAPHRLTKSGVDPEKLLQDLYKLGFKASLIDETNRKVVEMGTPSVKDFKLDVEEVTNLHFKR